MQKEAEFGTPIISINCVACYISGKKVPVIFTKAGQNRRLFVIYSSRNCRTDNSFSVIGCLSVQVELTLSACRLSSSTCDRLSLIIVTKMVTQPVYTTVSSRKQYKYKKHMQCTNAHPRMNFKICMNVCSFMYVCLCTVYVGCWSALLEFGKIQGKIKCLPGRSSALYLQSLENLDR